MTTFNAVLLIASIPLALATAAVWWPALRQVPALGRRFLAWEAATLWPVQTIAGVSLMLAGVALDQLYIAWTR